jgi:hypothetical protein
MWNRGNICHQGLINLHMLIIKDINLGGEKNGALYSVQKLLDGLSIFG